MADKINSFTQLNAWQQSHQLAIAVLQSCETLTRYDTLRNQMERCSISIASNIAEGFGRQSLQDKKHFYVMARGSAYELQSQLLLARDTNKISGDHFKNLVKLSLNSTRLLHGLIRSLDKKKAIS